MEPSNITKPFETSSNTLIWTPQVGYCIELQGIYLQVDTDDTEIHLVRGSSDVANMLIRKGVFAAGGGIDTPVHPIVLQRDQPLKIFVTGGTVWGTLQGQERK